jgi:hypothetical protein
MEQNPRCPIKIEQNQTCQLVLRDAPGDYKTMTVATSTFIEGGMQARVNEMATSVNEEAGRLVFAQQLQLPVKAGPTAVVAQKVLDLYWREDPTMRTTLLHAFIEAHGSYLMFKRHLVSPANTCLLPALLLCS